MGQEKFYASVQYGDMKGTASADRHDDYTMEKCLEEKGLIQADEMLVGVSMWSGEVHERTQDKTVYVTALVTRAEGYENLKAAVDSGNPLQVRKIRLDMHLNEFFGLFKRFEICISNGGLIDRKDIEFHD
jgi:hypothetical protein